jgi:muconolactone delta-isomerase
MGHAGPPRFGGPEDQDERGAAREQTRPRGRRPKRPDATPEQLAARAQDAEARRADRERKERTRRLIRMGGVLAAYGFSEPEQVEEILDRMLGSRMGPTRLREVGVRETDRWPPNARGGG